VGAVVRATLWASFTKKETQRAYAYLRECAALPRGVEIYREKIDIVLCIHIHASCDV